MTDSAREIASESLEAYLLLYHHLNSLGDRCTLMMREWLLPIYLDTAAYIVLMKSVQCGISEYLTIFTLAEMMRGNFVLYGFPTDTDRDDFAHTRFERVVDGVPLYTEGKGSVDNVGLKHFWQGGAYFVTTGSKTAFKSKTVQAVAIDELDQCNMANLVYAKDRTAATGILLGREPKFRMVGNPTISGYGIHSEYNKTDKKVYSFKCPHCNEWQDLRWEKNICRQIDNMRYELFDTDWAVESGDDVKIMCKKCMGTIEREDATAEWIARSPGVDRSGYHISQLITYQFKIKDLWADFIEGLSKPLEHQAFINSKLGLPYSGTGEKLSYDDLDACSQDYHFPNRHSDTIAGVDVGKVLHVRIDCLENGCRKMVWAGIVPNDKQWTSLHRLFERMGVKFCIIDALPETNAARTFIESFRKGFLCFFTKGERSGRLDPTPAEKHKREISVNRTEQLDNATSTYIRKKAIIPASYRNIDNGDWINQMFAPTRILDVKRNPPVYVWDSGDEADHHRFADCYCNMAATLMGWGTAQSEIIFI